MELTHEELNEMRVQALHDLLADALKSDDFGVGYSKFLRKHREALHPAGMEDIRTIGTKAGLKFKIDLGDRLGCDLFYGFLQEDADFRLLTAMVEPGAVVIDVGSNFGLYALVAAVCAGEAGKVIAIEPNPRSRRLLEDNIALNGLQDRVTCSPVCLGDRDGETQFYSAIEPSFSGMVNTGRSKIESVLTVPVRRLDSILHDIGCRQVDVVKIDVEGSEFSVIEGAFATLKTSDPVIMFELSEKNLDDARGEALKSVLSRLFEDGYGAWSITPSPEKLLAFDNAAQLVLEVRGGNVFMARRESARAARLVAKFPKIIPLLRVRNGFFRAGLDQLVLGKLGAELAPAQSGIVGILYRIKKAWMKRING